MTICDDVRRDLGVFVTESLSCGKEESGYDVVTTPFLYPDRDKIELFIKPLPGGRVLVSDLGQTMMKLSAHGFEISNTPRRRAMVYQITSSCQVRYENGSVLVSADADNTGQQVWNVLMAVQRLSDLVFTVTAYTKATFSDEFEEFIVGRHVGYRRAVPIALENGYSFTADFIVAGSKVVQLLSSSSVGYASQRIARVYQQFGELKISGDNRERIAVVDDRQPVWEPAQTKSLLHQADRVLTWSARAELGSILVAA